MNARLAEQMPTLETALSELEEQSNSGHGNHAWIRARTTELRNVVNAEANPVLRTEFLRRLDLLEGASTRK